MKIVCVIPARFASTRFPGKMLADLNGSPLLQWTIESAKKVSLFSEIAVATDHEEIYALAESCGVKAFYTSKDCASGTDRLVELQKKGLLRGEIWVNWQGDEPFIPEEMIEQLLQDREADIMTLCREIPMDSSPHIVKLVKDKQGQALYFSREAIPFGSKMCYQHIGLYAFSDRALTEIGALSPTELEKQENLEQLRFLEAGMKIQVHETPLPAPIGINTPEDLALASIQ